MDVYQLTAHSLRRQKYNEFVVCQYKNPDNAVAACKTQLWHANNICPAEWVSFLPPASLCSTH